jgi:hypothetical protein
MAVAGGSPAAPAFPLTTQNIMVGVDPYGGGYGFGDPNPGFGGGGGDGFPLYGFGSAGQGSPGYALTTPQVQPQTYDVKNTGQYVAGGTLSPDFTNQLLAYLSSQIGKGATPYSGQVALPSTGGVTDPGQLSAGMTPLLADLAQQLQGALTGTGGGTLGEMVKTGMPVSQTAQWAKMQSAMDRQYRMGEANVAEGFAVGGGMASSPYGQAMTDYNLQAAREKAALYGGMETTALESAAGRQIQAMNLLIPAAQKLGELFQGMDQAAIDRTLAEFTRTQPEYGPLLNLIYGLATTFPPYLGKSTGIGATGAVLAGAGSVAQGAADIYGVYKKAHPTTTGTVGGCWILTALYGKNDWRTRFLWAWMTNPLHGWSQRSLVGKLFVKLYYGVGEAIAKAVKKNRLVELVSRKFFDWMLYRALKEMESDKETPFNLSDFGFSSVR